MYDLNIFKMPDASKTIRTEVELMNRIVNVGKQKLYSPCSAFFELRNSGNYPLVINSVSPDCNCTASDWSKEPIAPQGMCKIKLTYNGRMPSFFQQKAILDCNNSGGPILLVMRGEME